MEEALKFIELAREIHQKPSNIIPLHVPVFHGKEKDYLLECIDSTFVSSVGKYVDEVEFYCASYTGTKKAVAVVNGTAALQIALKLIGVNNGDEVLTQALTFVATANSITYNGAKPVFIDVDRDTMGLSPTALENFLSEFGEKRENEVYNKKTGACIKAVLPMHTFGFLCRIDEIKNICDKWGLPLVEDSAEALGSFKDGKSAGSFGELGIFSFNGNKIITSGGGGIIVTNKESYGLKAKHITTTAKKPHIYEYVHDELGFNFRMPNLNAALLLGQFELLDYYRDLKKKVYENYFDGLSGGNILLMPVPETTTKWNYWLISILLENKTERDIFLKLTNKQGVMTRPIWQLMYRLPMYVNCQRDEQLNAKYLEERVVNIPSSARKI
jgi:perosamine synthetase